MAERKTDWLQKISWAGIGVILAACAKETQNGPIHSTGETPINQPQVTRQKEGDSGQNINLTPLPIESTVNPTPEKNDEEKIRVEYNSRALIYNILIDAKSVKEYIDLRQEAVSKTLKDLNIDPCANNVYWPIPPEIKDDFTKDDLLELHQITCPSRTISPPKTPTPTRAEQLPKVEGISPQYQKDWEFFDDGFKAPDFEARDLVGNSYRLSDFKGQPIILAICSFVFEFQDRACSKTIEILDKIQKELTNQDVQMSYLEIAALAGQANQLKPEIASQMRAALDPTKVKGLVYYGDFFQLFVNVSETPKKEGESFGQYYERVGKFFPEPYLPIIVFIDSQYKIRAQYSGSDVEYPAVKEAIQKLTSLN